LVEDLNHLYKDEFIEKLEQVADLTSMGSDIFKPTRLHQLSMYLEGEWFALEFKSGYYDDFDPINSLDAHLLSKHILGPILEIHDLKTDKRIEFMDGVKGMQGLKDRVDSERAKVAFGLFPVSIEQLKHVADTGNSMPPKSTYVEPKLRSGLTIFPIEK
jgi:uncharacterized protein (DUF1015 family)